MNANIGIQKDKLSPKAKGLLTLTVLNKPEVLAELFSDSAAKLTAEQRKMLLEILPAGQSVSLKITAVKEYSDRRDGFEAHRAIDFTVKTDRKQTASLLLQELLGEQDAHSLMKSFGNRLDFSKNVPVFNKVTLFTKSNYDPPLPISKGGPDYQKEDVAATGLKLADNLKAIIVCAALVRKAKDAGVDFSMMAYHKETQSAALNKLNPFEVDFLSYLAEGRLRISGDNALSVDDEGRLKRQYAREGCTYTWALASVS